jgi:hypothetical protein
MRLSGRLVLIPVGISPNTGKTRQTTRARGPESADQYDVGIILLFGSVGHVLERRMNPRS